MESGNHRSSFAASDIAAGGGVGGALVFAINTFIPDPKMQSLLLYLAPTASIIAMGLYSFAAAQASEAWKAYQAERARKKLLRQAKNGLETAKRDLKIIEDDPAATAQHKTDARDVVQNMERAVLKLNVKGIISFE